MVIPQRSRVTDKAAIPDGGYCCARGKKRALDVLGSVMNAPEVTHITSLASHWPELVTRPYPNTRRPGSVHLLQVRCADNICQAAHS